MSALMCGRAGCHTNAMPERINGLLTDPPGWAHVTIVGHPIVNRLLCPTCTREVRELLAARAGVVDRAAEAAFGRGYEKGQEDTLELTAPVAGEVPA